MSNEKQLPPCDAEVFEKGESIGLFPGLDKEDVERLCKGLSAVTGWRIDWSYFAGRPHIRALAPAQQYPGLATAWFDPGYQEFISAQGREATLRIGDGDRLARYSVPLFTGAQAGEVVALRSAILRAGEREHELRTELAGLRQHKTDYMEAAEETRKALLAQLADRDALLRQANGLLKVSAERLSRKHQTIREHIDHLRDGIEAALSASAEPSAPKCKACGDTGVIDDKGLDELPTGHFVERGLVTCKQCEEPSAPVECAERAGFEAYCAAIGLPIDRLPSGEYLIPAARFAYQGWHARAALERKAAEAPVFDNRTSFEAEFPVPFWAEWSEAEQSYLKSEDHICSATALAMYRQAWKSWQGGRAGLTTWMRRAIEAESKLRTYDPRLLDLGAQAMDALFVEPKPKEYVLTKCKLCDQLQAEITTRDQRLDQFEQVMQKVATLRGTLDLHGLREEVEALLWPDLHSRPEERGTPETEPCSGCGTPGWTGACDKCIPY
ncbi:hypothetical protein IRZ59_21790 [Pseudomonas guariconensis]|uniref:hypothetical protein n=1 Tax=Pseudomonas guariconensis TaxID=1288410 RepID=UPI0018AB8DFC|nr:hypothetical protein [Pseudomonas guariconensis]MBF8733065.1 hypothetical protein [Pseudomonas guariconensis]